MPPPTMSRMRLPFMGPWPLLCPSRLESRRVPLHRPAEQVLGGRARSGIEAARALRQGFVRERELVVDEADDRLRQRRLAELAGFRLPGDQSLNQSRQIRGRIALRHQGWEMHRRD